MKKNILSGSVGFACVMVVYFIVLIDGQAQRSKPKPPPRETNTASKVPSLPPIDLDTSAPPAKSPPILTPKVDILAVDPNTRPRLGDGIGIGSGPGNGHDSVEHQEVKAVRACYNAYKSAVMAGDGNKAYSLVTRSTIDYYRELLRLAVSGTEKDVRQLSFINRIGVLAMRHRIERERLLGMTADDFFIYSIEQGWISKNSVLRSSLGRVGVFENNAAGVFVLDGKETPVYYRFIKENGQWKIDLNALMPISEAAFKAQNAKDKIDEDELIMSTLEAISGRKPSNTIWQPLTKAK